MCLGSQHQLAKLTISQLSLLTTTSSSTVDIVSTANDLGVILNGQLTMTIHTSRLFAMQVFFPDTSAAVGSPISDDRGDTCVQAFISCRLDYCNSVLTGVPDVYL